MALTPKLELRQSQSLVMTPQLMQAIKLLQLGNLDLVAYVEAELERNPLLEREEGEERGGADATEERGVDAAAEAPSSDAGDFAADAGPSVDTAFEQGSAEIGEKLDADFSNVFQDDGGTEGMDPTRLVGETWSQTANRGSGSDEDYNLESYVAAEVSLADHLAEQLALAVTDPMQRLIGRYLIDAVDEAGYLRTDVASVAEKLGATIEQVEAVLAILQGFEPAGVCARSLEECLRLQLQERDRYDPAMRALVENLELLARRDFAALRRLTRVDDEDLADMVAEIRALNPKPGNAFGSTLVQPVVPDVVVRAGPDGGWLIELNSETLPKVLVNQSYFARVSRTAKGEKDRLYLSECMQTANWLVKSLDQRAKTILKVSSEIVRQQDAFLTHGIQHLKPLNLRIIADAVGMHESTVSRVTSNKYMATSRGIFELKYFFTSSIASSEGGEAHSSESVRHRIKELIDRESPAEVLSDDTIVKMLRDAGIDIARRTVAKYREAMNIPSSVQRRREKQALA